jgi:hypothetical protein
MGGVHDILADDDGIWVACTSADLLIKLNWQGSLLDTWEWRRSPDLRAAFGYGRLPRVDRTLDYRNPENMRDGVRNTVHLNNLASGQGGIWISLGRVIAPGQFRRKQLGAWLGKMARLAGIPMRQEKTIPGVKTGPLPGITNSSWAVVHLKPDSPAVIKKLIRNTSVPNHNVWVNGKELVFNDTNRDRVVRTSLDGSGTDLEIPIPGSPGFLRGLLPLGGSRFLVGSQNPLAIYEVDFDRAAVIHTIRLQGKARESVYGIYALPDDFGDPPETLGVE